MATNTRLNLKLSLPRPEFLHHHHKKSQRLPPTPEEGEEFHFEAQQEIEAQEGGDSAEDATEWIKNTIREQGRWEEHLSLIRVDCPHTMSELRRLGRLSKSEGTRQCRRMIRIPVLYDEIGCFLWERLAALERGPDFGREDEERAAEYARGVSYRTMVACLDERFRFDAPGGGTTTKTGRARQDSEPISPKHVRQAQAESSRPATAHQSRPNTSSHDCHFCQCRNTSEHPAIPDDITAEALDATRGRVVDQYPPPSRGSQTQGRASRSTSRSSSRTRRPSAFFNHSRSSSYSSTLLWRHERHDSVAPASSSSPVESKDRSASGSGSSVGSASAQGRQSRDGSIGSRVGSVVGNIKGVAVAIGGGLAHGYGYGGRADRSGSFWSV